MRYIRQTKTAGICKRVEGNGPLSGVARPTLTLCLTRPRAGRVASAQASAQAGMPATTPARAQQEPVTARLLDALAAMVWSRLLEADECRRRGDETQALELEAAADRLDDDLAAARREFVRLRAWKATE